MLEEDCRSKSEIINVSDDQTVMGFADNPGKRSLAAGLVGHFSFPDDRIGTVPGKGMGKRGWI
jgi:hypothetical protein